MVFLKIEFIIDIVVFIDLTIYIKLYKFRFELTVADLEKLYVSSVGLEKQLYQLI